MWCFQDPRCAVRTEPSTVIAVSGDSFILVTCKYRPPFKSGKRWDVGIERDQHMFSSPLWFPVEGIIPLFW